LLMTMESCVGDGTLSWRDGSARSRTNTPFRTFSRFDLSGTHVAAATPKWFRECVVCGTRPRTNGFA
jgi:hypothetical protein